MFHYCCNLFWVWPLFCVDWLDYNCLRLWFVAVFPFSLCVCVCVCVCNVWGINRVLFRISICICDTLLDFTSWLVRGRWSVCKVVCASLSLLFLCLLHSPSLLPSFSLLLFPPFLSPLLHPVSLVPFPIPFSTARESGVAHISSPASPGRDQQLYKRFSVHFQLKCTYSVESNLRTILLLLLFIIIIYLFIYLP